MSKKIEIIGPKALPKALNNQEYNEYLDGFRRLEQEKLFTRAYRKSKKSDLYELHIPKSVENDGNKLWDSYAAISKDKWRNYATVTLVAEYIYEHKIKCGRIGDSVDDYGKAKYLVDLVNYLNQKHSHVIRLRQDEEMEEIIDEINNIFDSAYFRKLNHPEIEDTECFFLAEREYCKDKDIDFLVYQLRDHDVAEMIHEHREIEALAEQEYLRRIETGERGNPKRDWAKAKEQYPAWLMKKRIATVCWNLADNKHQNSDFYWAQACAVISTLDALGISYISVSPYEACIHDIILEVVNGKKEPSNESQETVPTCA